MFNNQLFDQQQKLLEDVKKQIEIIFSDENLPRNHSILREIAKNTEGWLDINIVLTNPNLQQLTEDYFTVAESLQESLLLVVSEDCSKIRRKEKFPKLEDLNRRTIVAQGFPIQTSENEIIDQFRQYGEICDVILLVDNESLKFNGNAKIIFKQIERAEELITSHTQPVFKIQPIREETLNKTITVEFSKTYFDKVNSQRKELKRNDKDYSTKAYVGSLPPSETVKEQIEEIFHPFFPKNFSNIQQDQITGEDFIIITFGRDIETQQAIDNINFANLMIQGVVIHARKLMKYEDEEIKNLKLRSKRLIIDDIPKDCKRQEILKIFPNTNIIKRVQNFTDDTRQSQCAVVTFETDEQAKDTLIQIKRAEKQFGRIQINGSDVRILFCNEGQYNRLENKELASKANMNLKLINTDVNAKVKVMLFGISPTTSRQKVTNELKEFHPTRLILNKSGISTNQQIAEVEFDILDDAQDAVEKMNNSEFDGSVIHAFIDGNIMVYQTQEPQIKHSSSIRQQGSQPSRQMPSIIIRNLSNNTQDQNIRDFLRGIYVQRISIQPDQQSETGSRMAVVEFSNIGIAYKAQKRVSGSFLNGNTLHAEIVNANAHSPTNQLHTQQDEEPRSIFIGGVPRNVTRQEILNSFQEPKPSRVQMGEIKRTKQFAGFFQAVFDSVADRDLILEKMNRQIRLGGKLIRMKKFGQKDEVDETDIGIQRDNQEQQDDSRPIQEKKKLRIGNIPRNVTSEQLKEAFKQFGEVECTIAYDHNSKTSLGFGFADFATPAQAYAARNVLNGRNVFGEGRAIKITFARTQESEKAKLHISQLPPNITQQKLKQLFEKYGIKDLWILNPRTVKRPGQYQQQIQMGRFAFIVLNDENEIENAIREMNNMNLEGWRMKVDRAKSKEEIELQKILNRQQQENIRKIENLERKARYARQQADQKRQQANQQRQYIQTKGVDVQIYEAGANACEVFAVGFPTQQSDASLLQMFSSFGAVKALMAKDKITQQTKEFGFVTFLRQDQAINAVNSLNGSMNGGKKMKVTLSRDNKIQDKLQYIGKLLNEERQKIAEAERAEAEATQAEKELKDARLKICVQGPSIDPIVPDDEECPICCQKLSELESCECSAGKGHRLCCECLKESLDSDLHIYKLNLRCFVDPTCEAEYDMELIEKVLDERELLRIQELQAMEAGINPNQAEDDERERLAALKEQQQNEETEFTNLIVKTLTEALARHCPRCKIAIVKEIGCNHISCPCGEDFCYICEQSIAGVMMGHFGSQTPPCPQYIDDNAKINKERQKKQAGEKGKQFAIEHPGFEDLNGKLQRILEQYLS
ncbi:MAG: hypothetical protein EZS28_010576 [Streblomastix strix]|uniref:Uncharacterized protein n=1 Tax=Streblomastix strix TaxID=222440 RepID=A0A5J4WG81_9EUKA|nr:MAG: hypothetical protein EZS28_010576 [Streblomastix strix]